jgi:hypothetical protein
MADLIHGGFPRIAAPGTGRPAIQLTSGPAFNYPLYYYIPSITRDGRFWSTTRRSTARCSSSCWTW